MRVIVEVQKGCDVPLYEVLGSTFVELKRYMSYIGVHLRRTRGASSVSGSGADGFDEELLFVRQKVPFDGLDDVKGLLKRCGRDGFERNVERRAVKRSKKLKTCMFYGIKARYGNDDEEETKEEAFVSYQSLQNAFV